MASQAPLRILVVEDDTDIRAIAQMALEGIGHHVVRCVDSGREALAQAPTFAPDLILLDVMMPAMDGPETLHALRRVPTLAATPTVFLTAKTHSSDIEYLRGLGAAAVIVKPFDPMTLSATIEGIWANQHDQTTGDISELLAALRSEYAVQLPGRIAFIQQAWQAIQHSTWDSQAVDRLYRSIHNLAGSSGSYGFRVLSERARTAEGCLRSIIQTPELMASEQRHQLTVLLGELRADLEP